MNGVGSKQEQFSLSQSPSLVTAERYLRIARKRGGGGGGGGGGGEGGAGERAKAPIIHLAAPIFWTILYNKAGHV